MPDENQDNAGESNATQDAPASASAQTDPAPAPAVLAPEKEAARARARQLETDAGNTSMYGGNPWQTYAEAAEAWKAGDAPEQAAVCEKLAEQLKPEEPKKEEAEQG